MSRRKWNAREHLSAMQALEAELNAPEMLRAIADECEAARPLSQIRELHGDDWMDEEQADWEAGE